MNKLVLSAAALSCAVSLYGAQGIGQGHISVSGIFPHLAMYNYESECGIGAVVEWAGRLWAITYGRPSSAYGSSDKLYEITPDLEQIVHGQDVGGTPANRMIHRESGQLIIGSYFISADGKVRIIPPERMTGRLTGCARHLEDPKGKVYIATMEEGLYEVDVHTLKVKTLIRDGLTEYDAWRIKSEKPFPANWENAAPSRFFGTHGKGLCTGFGLLFYGNNGEPCSPWLDPYEPAGALGSWKPGAKDWTLVRRRQYTDISTADGIYGNEHPAVNPVIAMGWDARSAFLDVFTSAAAPCVYRFPKASYTYDGTHGWYTEWPRIRPVSDDEMLATMHGTLLSLPRSFAQDGVVAGLRPLSNYLKVITDFAPWKGRIVFGCDDSARTEFSNVRKAKGTLKTSGRSQSNLWFVKRENLEKIGPLVGHGGVWLNDDVQPSVPSEAYLLSGYVDKALYIRHGERHDVDFAVEIDAEGKGVWRREKTFTVGSSGLVLDVSALKGEWLRLVPCGVARNVTAWFEYAGPDCRSVAKRDKAYNGNGSARMLITRENPESLTIVADPAHGWELNDKLKLSPINSTVADEVWVDARFTKGGVVSADCASIVYVDDKNRKWRLPRAVAGIPASYGRVCREVCTERDLFSAGGTFFELPAELSGGFAKVRAVSSPMLPISDYASWRGMLALVIKDGEKPAVSGENGPRVIQLPYEGLSLWLGATDDIWSLGKAVGVGGPWKDSLVRAGEASDPYLANGYDRKTLTLSSVMNAEITLEADPNGEGRWYPVGIWKLAAGETCTVKIPDYVNASWLRVLSSADTIATAQFTYE